jgi:predicted dehydrogenase
MTKELQIGMVGLGYIGKIHAVAYRDIALCFGDPPVRANLKAVLRSRLDTEQEAMRAAGFEIATTDPDEFFALPLDVVDICSPNNLHREQAERALRAGMAVYCEKPLASNLNDARALAQLADELGATTQVAYVMRYTPAIRQMKALIAAGQIGEVLSFRGQIFHSSYLDPKRPISWRLRQADSGGGAFMDLGAHLVDMTRYLMGDVASVRAETRTFIASRCVMPGAVQHEAVDVDDWAVVTLELKNGAVGVLEVTRMAAGASEANSFEVYGRLGSVTFSGKDPERAQFHNLKQKQCISGALDLPPISGERPIEKIWPSGKYSQGYFVNHHMAAAYDLLLNLAEGKRSLADFDSGAAAQEVIEAAYLSASRGGERISLPL